MWFDIIYDDEEVSIRLKLKEFLIEAPGEINIFSSLHIKFLQKNSKETIYIETKSLSMVTVTIEIKDEVG